MRRRRSLQAALAIASPFVAGCLGSDSDPELTDVELVTDTLFHTVERRYEFVLERDDEVTITLKPDDEGLATVSLWSRTEASYLIEGEVTDGQPASFEAMIETPGEHSCTVDAAETEVDVEIVARRVTGGT